MITRQEAVEFFRQLQIFSERYFQKIGLVGAVESPWGHEAWTNMQPQGAALHYTADDSMERAVRWFMVPKFEARAAAHVVISDVLVPGLAELSKDLPMVAALKRPVVQCRKPETTAWHATWASGMLYGVECTNPGELRQLASGQWVWWAPMKQGAPEWTTFWKGGEPVEAQPGRFWAPWIPEQVQTAVEVLRYAAAFYGVGTWHRAWVTGHENVQSVGTKIHNVEGSPRYHTDKRDPGLLFPMADVRAAVFDGVPVESYEWFRKFQSDPQYALNAHVFDILDWQGGGAPVSMPEAWRAFWNEVGRLGQAQRPEALHKLALRMLGYFVGDVQRDVFTEEDGESVWLFQRCTGLVTDGRVGPRTSAALLARLQDRFSRDS